MQAVHWQSGLSGPVGRAFSRVRCLDVCVCVLCALCSLAFSQALLVQHRSGAARTSDVWYEAAAQDSLELQQNAHQHCVQDTGCQPTAAWPPILHPLATVLPCHSCACELPQLTRAAGADNISGVKVPTGFEGEAPASDCCCLQEAALGKPGARPASDLDFALAACDQTNGDDPFEYAYAPFSVQETWLAWWKVT